MRKLTEAEREELDALKKITDAVGMSFIHRSHWRESGYQSMVQRGLVAWSDPPHGFTKSRFAGTMITPAGRAALERGSR